MRLITPLVVCTLIFASCTSGPTAAPVPAPAGAPARGAPPANSNAPASGRIPVEKKALVKFADGTLDEYTVSEYDPSDVTLLEQNRFSASGGLMDQTAYAYDDQKRVVTTKMTRDQENRLKSRLVNEYDEPANPTRLMQETVVNKAGKPVSINRYTYNPNGTVATRSILNGANVPLAKTVYTYDQGGVQIVSSQTANGMGMPISSSRNTYDGAGNLVSQEIRNAKGAVTRRITTVWKDGKELSNTQTSGEGKIQLRITNEYGASGELLKRTVENIQGNSGQVLEYEYEFRSRRGRT